VSATANVFRAAPRHAVAAPNVGQSHLGAIVKRLIPLGGAVAALAIQLLRPTNPDVSWLLTVNERILAGATPYKDVIELNPPASILLYRLPTLVGKLLSARPEWVVAAMAALLVGGALAYAGNFISRYRLEPSALEWGRPLTPTPPRRSRSDRPAQAGEGLSLLPLAGEGGPTKSGRMRAASDSAVSQHSLCASDDNGVFLVVAALALAVLPFDELAQRDHIATIFMLPYALVAIARASTRRVAPADALIAGVLLGLGVAIKPHFALCALLVGVFQAWRSRDIMALPRIEYWAAATIVAAYLVGAALFFPLFFSDVLPKLADVYLPLRLDAFTLATRIAMPIALPLALCWMCRDRQRNAGTTVLLLIGAGFVGAYLAQGKGWGYHAYPAVAFFLIAAGWAAQQVESEVSGLPRLLGGLLLAAALILPLPRFVRADSSNPALAAAILRLAPHPRMLAIAFPLSFGHPLTRDIGGVWVGRTWGLWETGGALFMKAHAGDDPVRRVKADAYFDEDRLGAAQDIQTQRPDIVLIQKTPGFDFAQWIAGSPPLRAAMSLYHRADAVGDVDIYQRRGDAVELGDPAPAITAP
jgi:hypothetical protein